MKNYDDTMIINYSASNKLKTFVGKVKTTYGERKIISKEIVKQLCTIKYDNWLDFYTKSKKKDDLSDCFLQLLDYMFKQKIIESNVLDKICIKQLVKV
jgi:hypothetical protein